MFSVIIAQKVWTRSQLVILYMNDPCLLYMNNVGWGGWLSDKQLSKKYVFILTPKKICLMVQVSVILCRDQICFSMH